VNVHASLLPAYRGAAPIERALAAGEEHTGVSIMRMTEGLDEGPWALQRVVSIGLLDDAGSVGRLLATSGAVGIDQVLTATADGTADWTEQAGTGSYAEKVCARDCVLDTDRGAKAVHDQVRSLSPSIGARAASGDLEMKIWRTWPYGQAGLDEVPKEAQGVAGSAGRLSAQDGRLFVGCAEGAVEILALQPAGKGRMTAGAFLRGYGGRLGERLDQVAGTGCAPRVTTEKGGAS
jgi:methionyl-tRNA formyltransferase